MDPRAAALSVAAAVEAAQNPDAWNDVAVLAADALKADSASAVFWGRDGSASVRSCPRTDPDLHRRYDARMHALNYLWLEAAARPAGGVIGECTTGGREHYLKSAIYNEFIRPQGMDSVMLLTLTDATSPVLGILTIGRRRGRALFDAEDLADAGAFASALARTIAATGVARNLSLRADPPTTEVLVTREGRLLSRNAGLGELARAGIVSIRDGLLQIDVLPGLPAAIREAGRDPRHWPPPVGAVLGPVATPIGSARFAVSPGGLSAPGAVRVTISMAERGGALDAFARRHGLTPREADIAACLGRGMALPEIARQFGISLTTARTHLGRLFDKTGTRSQLSLALLVARDTGGIERSDGTEDE